MLEKNAELRYFDAHFHYFDSKNSGFFDINDDFSWFACSCAHSEAEWLFQKDTPDNIIKAAGIHPQSCGFIDIKSWADYIEVLLKENKLAAIGEAGFDYFTNDFKSHKQEQEEAWQIQLDLALHYNKPLVIHCRKANEKLFEYSSELKKLPSVLFHSFMGSLVEADSLIKRGINCCFSFGKQMMNNNKKVIDCVKNLPLENLLLETDAPFQFLKGEKGTHLSEIKQIYLQAIKLRNENINSIQKFYTQIQSNFYNLYQI